MQLRIGFAAVGGLALVMVAIAALTSGDRAEAGVSGGIHTTDINCAGVNLNTSYGNKLDVYLEGGPKKPGASGLTAGDYGVEVTAPNGTLLGKSMGVVIAADALLGEIPCSQLWFLVYKASDGTQGYDDTTNNGGTYKVKICLDDDFAGSNCKSDNFKVNLEEQPPFDACTAFPNREIIFFGDRLGDPSIIGLVEESAPQLTAISAGTYVLTMQSFDPAHVPFQSIQPQEQWVARFFGAGPVLDLQSAPISDLPDD